MTDLAVLVGARLRAERQAKGLSLGSLADAAGVGKGSLSEIENGARNATLSTLYALATSLGVPLAALLATRGTRVSSPGIEARLLDMTDEGDETVEVYRLHLDAGARHRSSGHRLGVTENLLVLSGRIQVGRLRAQQKLMAGESASWRSDTTHVYTALGTEPVESVLVIRSPATG